MTALRLLALPLSLGAALASAGAAPASGRPVEFTSLEAYRAEFRYLSRGFRSIDLSAPPVVTSGWDENVPAAEWPFMGMCYLGFACANLAKSDPGTRTGALAEMRRLIDAIRTPRMTGFIEPHFGAPFATEGELTPSAFVHGLVLYLLVHYREASGDVRYDGLAHRIARALSREFEASRDGVLRSYKDMWWLSDNFVAMGALARYDALHGRNASRSKTKLVASVKRFYSDEATGMFCTYVDAERRDAVQGPRGISQMYGLHFLVDFDPAFAREQYALARRHFVRFAFGLAAAREFPEGQEGEPDVDSGPVLFGLGLSASGFAIPAAAVMGDRETARALLRASVLVGAPEMRKGMLRYRSMPPVGQAVILFGKTMLLADERGDP